MRVWLVRDLDPLPIDPGQRRMMRSGQLALALAEAGHETTWITSNFDHYRKALRPVPTDEISVSDKLKLRILKGPGYSRNVGLQRVLHNRRFAQAFKAFSRRAAVLPDAIVADTPTTEAASAAIGFARERGIPSFLSIRDLWPDTFKDQLPKAFAPIAPLLQFPFQRQVRFACRNADSLIGISDEYLSWALGKAGREQHSRDGVFPLTYSVPPRASDEEVDRQLSIWGIESGKRVVAFVGSWGRTADLDLLVETAKSLAKHDDLVFVVGGDSVEHPAANVLKNLANVRLVGWLNAKQIGIVLDRSEVGLLPYVASAPQGLPNKFFEYMAHGCFQLGTLAGEAAGEFARTGVGRSVSGSAGALSAAILERLYNQGGISREEIGLAFRRRFSPRQVYGSLVRHIEGVVHYRPAAGASSYSASALRSSPIKSEIELSCRHLDSSVESLVRAWYAGEIVDFELDGDRSVRLAHPTRPDSLVKIKGAGLQGGAIDFQRRHNSNLVAPVFDFDGRVMQDVASGHDNAFLGGASFQQCVTEHTISDRLQALGYPVVRTLGYGSVSQLRRTSWFSVLEWPRDARSLAPPRSSIDEFVEANILYGQQALDLAVRHRLIGYFWYAARGERNYLIKDLHPFRQADPVNMSRLSWVMQVFFALHVVSLSTIHLAKRYAEDAVPEDLQVMLFRSVLPTVTKDDHEALRRDLVAPYMRTAPADFDPASLMAVLRGNRLTSALLDACPSEYAAYENH